MFLNSNYILASELVEKMHIHIANISIVRKKLEDANDLQTITKMGSCNFINTKSEKLPANIIKGIQEYQFTDMTDKLPCPYVKTEWNLTYDELYQTGIVTEKTTISGKDFYVFTNEFIAKVKNKICYVLNDADTKDCMNRKLIDDYIQISKNKYLTWYSLRK